MAPTPHDLIGLTEAARLLGSSRWTVRRMINRGELPGYRVGRLIKVSARDVDRAARRIPPAGGAS
ncbi:helix-turn-helix domain-containing protein [Streptomyces plumbiresistens]|uniref:Helix-turn-helix domain-containing protein n=1 Tax=Streptomyces plumbiresistens TaxID=511811 RepID=A0ABP7SSU0_9ACTN|nr:helix-turn-helix domain-containing protein [Streptomyces coralus]WLW55575.1 helix-turn-helix domain-containing protein [Streptomyces coralus]